MTRMIFVNIPVADVARSRKFYEALGFTINEKFSNDTAACVVISDAINLMILQHAVFQGFSTLPMADTSTSTAALIALSCEDRAGVDAMTQAAVAQGGYEPKPADDHGFMYTRTFRDPDGNVFEPFWMNPTAV